MHHSAHIKKMRLEQKFYDFGSLQKHFPTPREAIDYYNDMCHQQQVQWQWGVVNDKNVEAFVIECPFSRMCPVRLKFKWKKDRGVFTREGAYAIFHDHVLQRMREDDVPLDKQEDAKMLIRQSNKKITASALAEQLKIKPYEATVLIKNTPLMKFNMENAMSQLTSENSQHSEVHSMEGESAKSMLQSVSGLMSNMDDQNMSYAPDSSCISFQHEVSA